MTFAISRHIFRAIPTFTTRSGYAFINAPIFEVDVASATTTMMSWPASVRRPQRLLQLIFVRELVMPCLQVSCCFARKPMKNASNRGNNDAGFQVGGLRHNTRVDAARVSGGFAGKADMDQRTRTEKIFEMVQAMKLVKLSELSSELGVSMPMIRKDVDELQKGGRVERVHGNVRLASRQPKALLDAYNTGNAGILPTSEEKARIGRKAAGFISNGDSVILDCGATTTELARTLSER